MYIGEYSSRDVGILGERIAAEYLRRHTFTIVGTNIRTKFGELDIVAKANGTLHLVEVKTLRCTEFPSALTSDQNEPWENLHQRKIQKVARMAEWYVDRFSWEGEWQVDSVLVWLRSRDGMGKVSYYPQIL